MLLAKFLQARDIAAFKNLRQVADAVVCHHMVVGATETLYGCLERSTLSISLQSHHSGRSPSNITRRQQHPLSRAADLVGQREDQEQSASPSLGHQVGPADQAAP